MKIILLIFTFSFFFYACDSVLDSNKTKDQNGIVHKIEMSSWMYGTHTLDDSNGKPLYALTSSAIDLNVYESKQVIISGNLIDGYPVDGGPLYINVTNISVIK